MAKQPALDPETRTGLLASFGEVPNEPYEVGGEEEQLESPEEPQFVGSADNLPEDSYEEPVPETQEEEVSEFTEMDLVSQATEQVLGTPKPEESSELDRLRQEVANLQYTLQERLTTAEQEIKQEQETPQPQESYTEINWQDDNILEVVANELDLDKDQARRLGPLLGNMAQVVVDNSVGKEFKNFKEQNAREAAERKRRAAANAYVNNVRVGLQYAMKNGGLEEAVAKQFLEEEEDSLLAHHLKRFPSKFASPEGVMDAIVSVSRSVELMNKGSQNVAQQAEINTPAPKVSGTRQQVNAAMTKQVTEDQDAPVEMTPEEEIKARIRAINPNLRDRLPGFFS